MKRLSLPGIALEDLLESCISGVGRAQLKRLYNNNKRYVGEAGAEYATAAGERLWFQLPETACGRDEDPIVIGGLKKSHLLKLYNQYLVRKEKPARRFYDEIMAAANGKCPFCGGVGHPKTLDHYLPKSNYPQYSIVPGNLVPCCRDCNSVKGDSAAKEMGEQVVHPYTDSDCFFIEPWVGAVVVHGDPIVLQFKSTPPGHWLEEDKQRAQTHFECYELGARFSIEASAELSLVIHTRKSSLVNLSQDEFRAWLFDCANAPGFPVNSWRRVMFRALANDELFYTLQF